MSVSLATALELLGDLLPGGALAFVGDSLVRATLLLFALAAVLLLVRSAAAAHRHTLLTLGLAGCLALPALSLVVPAWLEVPVPTPSEGEVREVFADLGGAAAPEQTVGIAPSAGARAAVDTEAPSGQVGARPPAEADPGLPLGGPTRWLQALWIVGAAWLVGRLLLGAVRMWRVLSRARPWTHPVWREIRSDAGTGSRVFRTRLLLSPEVALPLTYGIGRPVVVLPVRAREWDEERIRVVLMHEVAHVIRRDWLLQIFGQIACALYWFHPGVWWAAARQRLEAERASDQRVVASGTRPADYASHLLDIVRTQREVSQRALPAVSMLGTSELEERFRAMLEARSSRPGSLRLALSVLLLTAAVGTLGGFHLRAEGGIGLEQEMAYLESLAVSVPALKDEALRGIREGDPVRTAGALAGLLEDPSPEVREYAICALSELRGEGVAEVVAGFLAHPSEGVRKGAAEALARGGDAFARAALLRALDDPRPEVSGAALHGLGRMGPREIRRGATAALDHPDPGIRQRAVLLLGANGGSEGLLISAARDGDARVRSAALHGLGRIGSGAAAPIVLEALDDDDARVREQAARALVRLREDGVVAARELRRCEDEAHVAVVEGEGSGKGATAV